MTELRTLLMMVAIFVAYTRIMTTKYIEYFETYFQINLENSLVGKFEDELFWWSGR